MILQVLEQKGRSQNDDILFEIRLTKHDIAEAYDHCDSKVCL